MNGLALAYSALPLSLIARHGLDCRVVSRGGECEVRFLWSDWPRVLPVWHRGHLLLATWGCRWGESKRLPRTRWTWLSTFTAGGWVPLGAEYVEIPATLLLDRTLWYGVRQGVQGLLARDEQRRPRVYILCEPASYYYRIMTRSHLMPVLIGERI
jgi:hypothetical protein